MGPSLLGVVDRLHEEELSEGPLAGSDLLRGELQVERTHGDGIAVDTGKTVTALDRVGQPIDGRVIAARTLLTPERVGVLVVREAVASPKHAAVVRRQGRLEESFVRTVIDALGTYLEPPSEGSE
jgi:hypothetical protein